MHSSIHNMEHQHKNPISLIWRMQRSSFHNYQKSLEDFSCSSNLRRYPLFFHKRMQLDRIFIFRRVHRLEAFLCLMNEYDGRSSFHVSVIIKSRKSITCTFFSREIKQLIKNSISKDILTHFLLFYNWSLCQYLHFMNIWDYVFLYSNKN